MKDGEQTNKGIMTIMSMVRTADLLNRYLEIELAKHNTTRVRFAVMNTLISNKGKMTPTEISKWTFRAKHTISSMLSTLETIGFVRREPSGNDGRSVNIVVTDKGWEATKRMTPIAEKVSQRALSCMDEEELVILLNLSKVLRNHLLKHVFGLNSRTDKRIS